MDFGGSCPQDRFDSYTAWGIRSSAFANGIYPAIAVKDTDDMYISRLLHPTYPETLVPDCWWYSEKEGWTTSDRWASSHFADALGYARMDPGALFTFSEFDPSRIFQQFAPEVRWFTLEDQRRDAQVLSDLTGMPPALIRPPRELRESEEAQQQRITATEIQDRWRNLRMEFMRQNIQPPPITVEWDRIDQDGNMEYIWRRPDGRRVRITVSPNRPPEIQYMEE